MVLNYNKGFNDGIFDFSKKPKNLYFVGDLHGDFGLLLSILIDCCKVVEWIPPKGNNTKGSLKWIGKDSFVIFCGDLCDRLRTNYTDIIPYKIGNKKILRGYGEIENEELKIFKFINYINLLAKKEGGKLVKIVGNHEMMYYGPVEEDFHYFEDLNYKEYIKSQEDFDLTEFTTPLTDYIDEKHGGRIKRFAPGGDINREIVKDNIYGIIMIKNSRKKWIACHGGINENMIYGLLEFYTGKKSVSFDIHPLLDKLLSNHTLPPNKLHIKENKIKKSLKMVEDKISLWNENINNVLRGFNNFIDYKVFSSILSHNPDSNYQKMSGILWERYWGNQQIFKDDLIGIPETRLSIDKEGGFKFKMNIPKKFNIKECEKLINEITNELNSATRLGYCTNCYNLIKNTYNSTDTGLFSDDGSILYKHIQCPEKKNNVKVFSLSKKLTTCVKINIDPKPDKPLYYKDSLRLHHFFYIKLYKYYNSLKKFPVENEIYFHGCCDHTDCIDFENIFKFDNKLDKSINMVIAHCPQNDNLYRDISKLNEKDLEDDEYGAINHQCDKRIWRIDSGMSRAFDNTEETNMLIDAYDDINTKKLYKKFYLKIRGIQILHVDKSDKPNILRCNYDLNRSGEFEELFQDIIRYREPELEPNIIFNSISNKNIPVKEYKLSKKKCNNLTPHGFASKKKNYYNAILSFKKTCNKNYKNCKTLKKKNTKYLENLYKQPTEDIIKYSELT